MWRRAVPVVQHLGRKDHIEGEASNESIKNELIVHFLQGSEDAGEGASEIVEDL